MTTRLKIMNCKYHCCDIYSVRSYICLELTCKSQEKCREMSFWNVTWLMQSFLRGTVSTSYPNNVLSSGRFITSSVNRWDPCNINLKTRSHCCTVFSMLNTFIVFKIAVFSYIFYFELQKNVPTDCNWVVVSAAV